MMKPTGTRPDRVVPLVRGERVTTHLAPQFQTNDDGRTMRGTQRNEKQQHAATCNGRDASFRRIKTR